MSQEDYLPEGWIKCQSKSIQGKVYYFNIETGISLWEHPSEIAAEKKANESNVATTVNKPTVKTSNTTAYTHLKPTIRRQISVENKEDKKVVSTYNGTSNDVRKVTVNGAAGQEQRVNKDRTGNKRRISQESSFDDLPSKQFEKRLGSFPSELKNSNKTRTAKLAELLKTSSPLNSGETKMTKNPNNISAKMVKDKEKYTNSVVKNNQKISAKSQSLSKPLKKSINRRLVKKMMDAPANNQTPVYKIPKRTCMLPDSGGNSENSKSTSKLKAHNEYNRVEVTVNGKQNNRKTNLNDFSSLSTECNFQKLKDSGKSFDISSPSWTSSDLSDIHSYSSDAAESQVSADMPCEAMEVDDVEFMEKTIFKEIQDVRMEKIPIPKSLNTMTEEEGVCIQDEKLFIILDTNVMLAHLKFVSELKDSPIPGAGRPVVVVPWMVMQELDRLKDAPDSRIHESNEDNEMTGMGVNILARKAIAFLHSCFSQNHPRIRGQTVAEASHSTPGFVEETNDDSILSCCLYFKKKAANGMAVLLSNDRNLCNKAIVNDVKAFTKKNLINGLRDIFQSGSIVVHRDHFKEYFVEARIQEAVAQRKKEVDNITCELQCILREAFAAAIEKEMIEVYDNIWLEIVKIKPPWTLMDTLDLLEKHWIAIFGQIVNRKCKENVIKLKTKLSSADDSPKDLHYASELIDLGFSLCNALSRHSDYNGVMPKCLAAIIVLQRRCKELISNASPALINENRQLNRNSPPIKNPPPLNRIEKPQQISESITSVLHNEKLTDEARNNLQGNPTCHFAVMSTFDEIWKAVVSTSSSIFEVLKYPNPFPNAVGAHTLKPTREEALNVLQTFVSCMNGLVQSIQSVLACSPEASVNDVNLYSNLGSIVEQFMKTMMDRECNFTLEQLRSFCLDNLSRTALIKGLSQLDRVLAMLMHCLKCCGNNN